jgi:hypothetical protein
MYFGLTSSHYVAVSSSRVAANAVKELATAARAA